MMHGTQNGRNNDGVRSRRSGARRAGVRRHGTAYEFPSLWESMEEDVSDQFEDLWRRF